MLLYKLPLDLNVNFSKGRNINMSKILTFIRSIFLALCIVLVTTYTTTVLSNGITFGGIVLGIAGGAIFGLALIGLDLICSRFNLRTFNIAILGLLLGYLMGEALMLIFTSIWNHPWPLHEPEITTLLKGALFLTTSYLGMVLTARASEELHLSIPFVKLKATGQKKHDILIDPSILADTRIIDLASSGIMDNHLIMPRFALKELQCLVDNADESIKTRAKRSIDVLRKLEGIPLLEMRYSDSDFPNTKDSTAKLVQLARMLDANILTADMTRIQQSAIEGIRIININSLSHALKPLTHAGEYISIKIQRYGKEPRQGVGYLDDGTMVVVNGGAEFIGDTIKAQVLSVKHTSSGRMIFCNTAEDMLQLEQESTEMPILENAHKNYFSI